VEEWHKPYLELSTTYRRTHTDYKWDAAYVDRHIFGLKSSVKLYSGPGTTLLAQTDYNYDEGYLFLPASVDNVIQHDTANYGDSFIAGRGNLTSTTQYSVTGGVAGSPRILGARSKYDTYGCVRGVLDPENRATGFETWDNFSNKPGGVGETHAMTTSVIAPADLIGGVMLNQKNGAKFDYYTGLPVQTFHINASTGQPENTTNYTYTTGDRISSVTRPDDGYTNYAYWDNLLSQATYELIDDGKQRFSFIALDGAGQMRWRGREHPNGTPGWFSIQRQFYDSVGRTTSVSNVTAADGGLAPLDGETWYYTTTEYDALDRPLKIYRQDHTGAFNSYTQFDYIGCGCAGASTVTITDERGKKRKQVRDFLGRLAEAHDLTAGGATYSKAVYSYTALDQLWKVEHYDGGAKRQERTFAFDGYGRRQSVNTPEIGASGGDGVDYTYTYTPDDLLYSITDARNITTTFGYNNRRLLTQVNYGDADTPDVVYDYGEYGERRLMEERNNSGTALGRTTYDYWADMKLKSETRQFEMAGNPLPQGASSIMRTGTYKLEYTWNTSGGLNRMTATVNGWVKNVNFGWNYAGASTGVGTNIIGTNPDTTTNVVSGLQYRGFGGLRQESYGNGRKLTVGYDLRRQQMTSLFLRKNDESDPLINVSYDYSNGGGNNGRLQRLIDSYDPGYSVTYEYDDFQRLKKATAGNFTREYGYDAWGNLTSLFNVTGPTETGNYTINYATNSSGAPANNRILNVNGGVTHSYDDAGNLSFDGWSYSHDAANRLKSVNGGNVTYNYDGDGRRVKNQVSPYAPIYYLWSSVLGQVAAEISGCDGSVFRAYVYGAGGQLLAQQSYDGQFYWAHRDYLGSGVRLTDASGTMIYRSVLDPHGQVLLEWAQNSETYKSSKKFTGYEREWATNLDFARARYYHHNRGRFLQPDPMGLDAADVTAPQTLNRYSYVANDPVNRVDPTGHFGVPFQADNVCFVTVWEDPEGGIAGVRTICGTVMSGPISPLDVNVEFLEAEPQEAKKPTKDQCAGIRELLKREKEHGTVKASEMSSITFGSDPIQSLNNAFGDIPYDGGSLDIDWLLDIYATAPDVRTRYYTPQGKAYEWGTRGLEGGLLYTVGKIANVLGKYANLALTGEGLGVTYPFPFQDPGERKALGFFAERKSYPSIFTDEWMKANCPE
jgi:RHS repeat-associated protein